MGPCGMTSAGDFNRDGHPDFAVVLGNDERPSTWSSDQWFNVDEASCGWGYDQGGVYIFLGGLKLTSGLTSCFTEMSRARA